MAIYVHFNTCLHTNASRFIHARIHGTVYVTSVRVSSWFLCVGLLHEVRGVLFDMHFLIGARGVHHTRRQARQPAREVPVGMPLFRSECDGQHVLHNRVRDSGQRCLSFAWSRHRDHLALGKVCSQMLYHLSYDRVDC